MSASTDLLIAHAKARAVHAATAPTVATVAVRKNILATRCAVRLRFGVGHPRAAEHARGGGRTHVIEHVLKRAGGAEEALLRENLQEAADALPVLLEHGAERAKNRLHTRKPENT